MKVLVAGGAGFVGSHLCRRLISKGYSVYCIDNFYTGSPNNISDLSSDSNFKMIEHDICFPIDLAVDQIYNLACPASPVHYQRDAIQTIKTNIYGSINLLELAIRNGARILQASTSEVYGDPEVHPQPETYWGRVNPVGIRSCYDEGKRCVETIFLDYWRQQKVNIRIVRIFNTYGPNMLPNDGRVVSNFIFQALRGEDLTVYGDGSQTRSFQYVTDLIEGMILMMENENGFIGPVNLGNPSEFTILELAEKTLSFIPKSKSGIIFKPLPSDDPKQRRPDIALANQKLNWRPFVSLEQGLVKTISYFQEILA